MKYYLSSYKFGDKVEELIRLRSDNARIGHVNNSRDWVGADPVRANRHQQAEIAYLNELGFGAEPLDLKDYFGKAEPLKEKLEELGAVWVSGGNTFVLRMAMRLSGFDDLFVELQHREDFLYGGYSAGVCILSESLKAIDRVDEPDNFPYAGISKPIYEGLGAFPYAFLCHYDSDHPEAEAVALEMQRCIDNKWLF
jgi:dipeptidase E